MTVRQRAKRKPVRIWASQYSQDTGCMYFRNPRKVGEVTCFDYYCRGTEAWSEPK